MAKKSIKEILKKKHDLKKDFTIVMKKIHVLLPDPRPKLAEGKKQKT